MKIVIISSWFSEGMGYAENFLPKALAKFGHEVHVISSNAQIYYNSPIYKEVYESFIGPNIVATGVKEIDGYKLHRLLYYESKKGFGIRNLREYLVKLKPDILQTFNIDELATYDAAVVSENNGFHLFTECHIHASVFRMNNEITLREKIGRVKNRFRRSLKLINCETVKCYPISSDAAEIAVSYYGVLESKVKIQSLGVDTDLFKPCINKELETKRIELRAHLGFTNSDIVCIYTGRFTRRKNPQCLAKAIDYLNKQGKPYKGLFVGNGTKEDVDYIQSMSGCAVHSFVTVKELPLFYRAADIGVWPREESTSQLDAVACGLPIILSNKIQVMERIEGNGVLYEENNYLDLANKLLELENNELRKTMGIYGVKKIENNFSWTSIARTRLVDYEESLS